MLKPTKLAREHEALRAHLAALDSSPIRPLLQDVIEEFEFMSGVFQAGQLFDTKFDSYLSGVRKRIHGFPETFGSRFSVDTAQITTIVQTWMGLPPDSPCAVIPRYGPEWGHSTIPMAPGPVPRLIDLITLPGDDLVEDIDLLEYPWLCHEMGHNIHFRTKIFATQFEPKLRNLISSLAMSRAADRGLAKERSQRSIEELERFWTPTESHKNWSYEIAVDLMALWACGPAFISTFEGFLKENLPNPFAITQDHPPYEIRIAALIDASERLSWTPYLSGLSGVKAGWSRATVNDGRDNQYLALYQHDLIQAAVTCGLACCHELNLPLLTPGDLPRIEALVRSPLDCDFGTDLLVAAWNANQTLDAQSYQTWHDTVVNELQRAQSVTLECQ